MSHVYRTYRLRKLQPDKEWWMPYNGWVVEYWDRKSAEWIEAHTASQYLTANYWAWDWAKIAGGGTSPMYAEPGVRGVTQFELRNDRRVA